MPRALVLVSCLVAFGPLVLAAPAQLGCVRTCTNVAAPAIVVTLTNVTTGADVCTATVTVTANGETVLLQLFPQTDGTCNYQDTPGGPAGDYVVSVTAPGYAPAQRAITIETDNCGGDIEELLTMALTPNP